MANPEIKVYKRNVGLRDFYIAAVTKNDAEGYEAGVPVKIGRAISAKFSDKFNVQKVYSDDGVEEIIQEYTGTDAELEVNQLIPQDRHLIYGQLYENGFLVKSQGDMAPLIALGYRSKKTNGSYDFVWLYVGQFDQNLDEEYATKGENADPKTRSIKASFYAREKDGYYEVRVDESNLLDEHTGAKEAISDWFNSVQEPNPSAG